MVVWSTERPRSVTSSSTSRYEREYRKYHRTAHTMITGSKCRHLNRAGRGLHTAPAYQNLLDSRFATHPSGAQQLGQLSCINPVTLVANRQQGVPSWIADHDF